MKLGSGVRPCRLVQGAVSHVCARQFLLNVLGRKKCPGVVRSPRRVGGGFGLEPPAGVAKASMPTAPFCRSLSKSHLPAHSECLSRCLKTAELAEGAEGALGGMRIGSIARQWLGTLPCHCEPEVSLLPNPRSLLLVIACSRGSEMPGGGQRTRP